MAKEEEETIHLCTLSPYNTLFLTISSTTDSVLHLGALNDLPQGGPGQL